MSKDIIESKWKYKPIYEFVLGLLAACTSGEVELDICRFCKKTFANKDEHLEHFSESVECNAKAHEDFAKVINYVYVEYKEKKEE